MYFDFMIENQPNLKLSEVTTFLKLAVYTRDGVYVGHVKNVFLDTDDKKVSGLLVTNTNPTLVEGSVDVAVPYRWVNAIGDIVILSNFPNKVVTSKKEEKKQKKDAKEEEIEMIQ